MKSYTLPAIIAASVIAVATLLYALFFQGQDPEQAESVLVQNSIITEPTTKLVLHLFHVATDATAAIATLATGSILIREANKALDEAKAAR